MRTNSQNRQLQQALLASMLLDVKAFKPGNVSEGHPGHYMDAAMFAKSARITAPIIAANNGSGVGARILQAVAATRDGVASNTNLGIILLCVPLYDAMHKLLNYGAVKNVNNLRQSLATVLSGLDAEDGKNIYRAIRTADPGGLGNSDRYDVMANSGDDTGANVLAAMHHARKRDRVAMQYCGNYHDVCAIAWPCLARFHALWGDMAWALSACYIMLLCSYADSHIVRLHGIDAARKVQGKACSLWQKLSPIGPPMGDALCLWHDLDTYCKQLGLNPGTTADLAVAAAFIELWLQSVDIGD